MRREHEWNVGAVLPDIDGTLLDTEKVYFNSLVDALNAAGYPRCPI